MKWKNQLTGMKPYQPGRSTDEVKEMFGLETIVKLASNENPFGFSPKVSEFLENQSIITLFTQMVTQRVYVKL